MKIYLAGKIPKGNELENCTDWRAEYKAILSVHIPGVEFLDPDNTPANGVCDETDAMFWFGHDISLISQSNAVVVYCHPAEKLGVGTSMEFLFAKYYAKPLVVVLPKNTPHRQTNLKLRTGLVEDWIHPFIAAPADLIVEKLEDALPWFADIGNKKIKDWSVIETAKEYHEKIMGEYYGRVD